MNGRFRNLRLFWKLLVPFLTLMVLFGAFGLFVIVRDISTRAETALDHELSRRALDARSLLRDRELHLVEAANLAANLAGMADAVRARDARAAGDLLRSVIALKSQVGLLAVTDATGAGIVEWKRPASGTDVAFASGTRWSDFELVRRALADPSGGRWSGFIAGDPAVLAIAAPICASADPCAPLGVAIAGMGADALAEDATGTDAQGGGVTLFDGEGRPLGAGHAGERTLPDPEPGAASHRISTRDLTAVYVPYEVQGRRVGTLAVGVRRAPAFAEVRTAALQLGVAVLGAMAAVVALGALLSKSILGQVAPLLDTNRALGRGELWARAAVSSSDEIGELARGVNQMAEQLQASYETLELRVAQRTEEVQRLLRERTEFFTAMSHELRTPLAVILGESAMIDDPSYPKDAEWTRRSAGRIGSSARQLLSLVNEVLDLARADSGHVDVTLECVSLFDVVDDVRPTLEGLAGAGGLEIRVDVARDLPEVRADRARLREVILNLVDNAVKYTPEPGRVEVSARSRADVVEVRVSDTGIGIPAGAGQFVFEPFYRVPGARPQRGQASSGLGLALAKRLVEAQGGSIGFVSRPGATTFSFTLPTVRDSAAASDVARRLM